MSGSYGADMRCWIYTNEQLAICLEYNAVSGDWSITSNDDDMSKTFPVPTSFIARYRYISNAIIRVADIKIPNFILFYTISAIYICICLDADLFGQQLCICCVCSHVIGGCIV